MRGTTLEHPRGVVGSDGGESRYRRIQVQSGEHLVQHYRVVVLITSVAGNCARGARAGPNVCQRLEQFRVVINVDGVQIQVHVLSSGIRTGPSHIDSNVSLNLARDRQREVLGVGILVVGIESGRGQSASTVNRQLGAGRGGGPHRSKSGDIGQRECSVRQDGLKCGVRHGCCRHIGGARRIAEDAFRSTVAEPSALISRAECLLITSADRCFPCSKPRELIRETHSGADIRIAFRHRRNVRVGTFRSDEPDAGQQVRVARRDGKECVLLRSLLAA